MATTSAAPAPESRPNRKRSRARVRVRIKSNSDRKPYADLALEAIRLNGRPVPTPEMVAFITNQQPPKAGHDPKKVRVNIQSGLSRDERIESVVWGNGRAWWYADREVPKEAA